MVSHDGLTNKERRIILRGHDQKMKRIEKDDRGWEWHHPKVKRI